MRRLLIGLLSTIAVSVCGCSSTTAPEIEHKTVEPFGAGEAVRPLQLTKIVVKLPRGQRIGTLQGGVFCIDQAPLVWRGGRLTLSGEEFTEAFREELEKANCPVVGDSDALFTDPSTWQAEFLVAGIISDMKADICYPMSGFGDLNTAKGSACIKVDWQIYGRLQRRVVYQTSTEGASNLKAEVPGGSSQVFLDAFGTATENLLADDGFRKLVVRPRAEDIVIPSEEVRVTQIKLYASALPEHVSQNRMGIATVFAGDGHGSGFFISQEGHLLTNEHVVGEARFVTVKLITGRELVAEVLRKNAVRDVALLKVEEKGMVPLPVRIVSPNVSDEVYVLGSPLKEELSATLTKGIISAFRVQDNQRLIQSDVNVLPGSSGGPLLDANGNVIGITALGIFVAEAPTGLNFFVPIDEALKALNITMAE